MRRYNRIVLYVYQYNVEVFHFTLSDNCIIRLYDNNADQEQFVRAVFNNMAQRVEHEMYIHEGS